MPMDSIFFVTGQSAESFFGLSWFILFLWKDAIRIKRETIESRISFTLLHGGFSFDALIGYTITCEKSI